MTLPLATLSHWPGVCGEARRCATDPSPSTANVETRVIPAPHKLLIGSTADWSRSAGVCFDCSFLAAYIDIRQASRPAFESA
jgi:hypothetical protein